MIKRLLFLSISLIPFFSLAQLNPGTWRGVLQIEYDLPFNFQVTQENGKYTFTITNGEEKIRVNEIEVKGDSLFARMPVFDSEFRLKISPLKMEGYWINHARKSMNVIPFLAEFGKEYRLADRRAANFDVTGKWEVDFSKGTEDSSKAIGVFKQQGNHLEGTFLTPTGDYRYLEGVVEGDNIALSCFDGSHAFLFRGSINEHEQIKGTFWSGLHWKEPWIARKNESFELPNPDSLTFLKPGYKKLEFSFPDLEGKTVSIKDEKFKNKVVVVQIMGSWCPNCIDETAFLSDYYNKKNKKDIEVVGLAFEKLPERAIQNLLRIKERFQVKYPILIAGTSDKKEAAKALPALNHIMSFPTTIFIDKKGLVRKIHTGFSGPATGSHYDKFREEFNLFVDKLLKE